MTPLPLTHDTAAMTGPTERLWGPAHSTLYTASETKAEKRRSKNKTAVAATAHLQAQKDKRGGEALSRSDAGAVSRTHRHVSASGWL